MIRVKRRLIRFGGQPIRKQYRFPCIIQVCFKHGLCNRLRGWGSIGALADLDNIPFIVCWRRDGECQSNFTDLFVPWRCIPGPLAARAHFKRPLVFAGGCRSLYSGVNWPCSYRRFTRGRNAEFDEKVAERWRNLKLRDEYQQSVDDFMRRVPDDVVGVHVRRTDLLKRHENSDGILCDRLDAEIEKNPDIQFLLCADNPASVRLLQERYGDRMHWRKQWLKEGWRKHQRNGPISEAAVDLFCLARTTRIIGTHRSSFSLFASRLGGIKVDRI